VELELPDPCLVVLVGAAGSGKSTLAARLFRAHEILSSDAYRELVSGDPADQRVTKVAFSILHRELDRRLAAGLTTVVDATNVTGYARRSLLRRATANHVPAVAIVLDLEATLVQARNATRQGRIVPTEAVEQQLAALNRSLRRDDFAHEGFAAIHVIRTAEELDGLTRSPGLDADSVAGNSQPRTE
jgi:protein phosphatase